MDSINIRSAYADDAQILAYIMASSWQAAFGDIISPEIMKQCTRLDSREQMFRSVLSGNTHNALICEYGGSPCALAVYESSPKTACEIMAFHSLPGVWGKGCGSALMNEVLADIRQKNCTHAFLWVFNENLRARKFYEKCGFVPDGAEKDSPFGAREMRYVTALK